MLDINRFIALLLFVCHLRWSADPRSAGALFMVDLARSAEAAAAGA